MALRAVELDIAVLEITPHLEHFRSRRLRASTGILSDTQHTHTHTHNTQTHTTMLAKKVSERGGTGTVE